MSKRKKEKKDEVVYVRLFEETDDEMFWPEVIWGLGYSKKRTARYTKEVLKSEVIMWSNVAGFEIGEGWGFPSDD